MTYRVTFTCHRCGFESVTEGFRTETWAKQYVLEGPRYCPIRAWHGKMDAKVEETEKT